MSVFAVMLLRDYICPTDVPVTMQYLSLEEQLAALDLMMGNPTGP